MKQVFLFLSVASIILFTSCEKDAEPEPITLTQDLQNGYWEVDFNVSKSVMKFEASTVHSYWIEGTSPCITDTNSQDYTLEGNILTMPSSENPLMIKIEGDVLTLTDEVDQMMIEFNRKSTLDYTDC